MSNHHIWDIQYVGPIKGQSKAGNCGEEHRYKFWSLIICQVLSWNGSLKIRLVPSCPRHVHSRFLMLVWWCLWELVIEDEHCLGVGKCQFSHFLHSAFHYRSHDLSVRRASKHKDAHDNKRAFIFTMSPRSTDMQSNIRFQRFGITWDSDWGMWRRILMDRFYSMWQIKRLSGPRITTGYPPEP